MALRSARRGASVEGRPDTNIEHAADGDRDPGELLSLLDAEYTLAILETVRDGAEPARTIADTVGASRPTVYRRLNALEDAGLVAERVGFDEQGCPRTVFEATLDTVTVDVADGLSVAVTTDPPNRETHAETTAAARDRAGD